MTRTRALASVGVVLAVAGFLPASAQQAQTQNSAPTATASALQDTLQIYCIGCHNGPTPFAGLNLEPMDFNNLEAHGETWEKLIRKLRGIGLEDAAQRLELAVSTLPPDERGSSVSADPLSTD